MTTCAFLLHTNAQAVEILIDDFSTEQALLTSDSETVAYSQVNGTGILGGYRDIYVETLPGSLTTTSALVSSGTFAASVSALTEGYVVVTYDGANTIDDNWQGGVDTDGLGGVDFSGVQGFSFQDIYNDNTAPSYFIIWSYDVDEYVAHILDFETLGLSNSQDDIFTFDNYISVSEFENYADINWSQIGAFQAIFNLNSEGLGTISGVDLALSTVTAVPEPESLSMLGAGLLMLGFAGYRRKKQP